MADEQGFDGYKCLILNKSKFTIKLYYRASYDQGNYCNHIEFRTEWNFKCGTITRLMLRYIETMNCNNLG